MEGWARVRLTSLLLQDSGMGSEIVGWADGRWGMRIGLIDCMGIGEREI
jgi:hypothetical protein